MSRRSASRLSTPRRIETSSMETGSSAISTFGRTASARAMATLCLWPPDSSCGNFEVKVSGGFRATRRSRSATAASALPLARWWIFSGRSRSWRMRCTGLSDANGSCRTIWTLAAYDLGRPDGAGLPSSKTCPLSGRMIWASSRATVVFPARHLPGVQANGDVVHGVHRQLAGKRPAALLEPEVLGEVAALEDRRRHRTHCAPTSIGR